MVTYLYEIVTYIQYTIYTSINNYQFKPEIYLDLQSKSSLT